MLDYALRLTHHRAGRRALFLALSLLMPASPGEGPWRAIESLLAPIIRRRGGEIFRLRNGDVAVIINSADSGLINRLTAKLTMLLEDDLERLAQGEAAPTLYTWFDLGEHYDAFLATVREIEASRRGVTPAPLPGPPAPGPQSAPAAHFNPILLTTIERWLMSQVPGHAKALAEAVPVARIIGSRAEQPALVLLEPRLDLFEALGLPRGDLERNPALGAHLLDLATRRLFLEIPKLYSSQEPLVIKTTLNALLGAELLCLHRAWAIAAWNPLTFLVSMDEFARDAGRYKFVLGMLRRFGHRLGIADVAMDSLNELALADADLIVAELPVPDLTGEFPEPPSRALLDSNPDRVVLSGIHSRQALSYAQRYRFGLIAGRVATHMLSAPR